MDQRQEILRSALASREQSVLMYQINIDNYTLALELMNAMSQQEQTELADFAQRLRDLLATEKLEQKKEIVMRDVIKQQLDQV